MPNTNQLLTDCICVLTLGCCTPVPAFLSCSCAAFVCLLRACSPPLPLMLPLLPQCPVFCQPHMAEAEPVAAGAAAPFAGSLTTPSSRQQRSTDSSASPDASTLPDPTAVSDNPPSGPRALLPPAAAIAAGPSNTLAATRSGRVLVCGASGSGQCGAAWVRAPACPGFVDLGPELSWHGLTRPSAAEVDAAGGQVADALAKVGFVSVARARHVVFCLLFTSTVSSRARPGAAQSGGAGPGHAARGHASSPAARAAVHSHAGGGETTIQGDDCVTCVYLMCAGRGSGCWGGNLLRTHRCGGGLCVGPGLQGTTWDG